ncbi:MAG: helix-turn-helix transcriptional regulator [Chroococcidiopsidaceae cyanobacterium CP_BM_RX_35]|nr:helix-turn-helix transcriptional regulator [Chroococcidiopsidaceae cyanobacterium CP_BM_RX_35]
MKSAPMTIKWNLAHLMFDRDIKTGDLAAATGLHANTISKLKAHREMPPRLDRDTLEKLCRVLNCQPADLLRYIPEETERAAS